MTLEVGGGFVCPLDKRLRERKMKEILLQIAVMTIGFIGGVMYTREVYKPIVRALKKAERELHRRAGG